MKNSNITPNTFFVWIVIVLFSSGCKKEFLEKKPNTGIVIPTTIDDMTQLLDNNVAFTTSTPELGILSGEEYLFESLEMYNSLTSKTARNCYVWAKDIYQGEEKILDWSKPYESVFYANVVLEQWEKLSNADKESISGKAVKANALFCRSYAFYNLVETFSPAYNRATAGTDLGIPIKLTANINNLEQRANLQQTYDRIIMDLESSIELYPDIFPTLIRSRSSKAAAYALLGRIYLSMREYSKALEASRNSLKYYDKLIDYNSLDMTQPVVFSFFNDELLYLNNAVSSPDYFHIALKYGSVTIDPNLIGKYETDDLRPNVFFRKIGEKYLMQRSYAGNLYWPFTGLGVDEVYLIKAECLARANDLSGANEVLNSLLIKRYKTGTYVMFSSSSPEVVLSKILEERRKELIWRGLRWSDLKRLNAEGANITLIRSLGGITYSLPPNDARYVLPIPNDELLLSHIQQNLR